MCECANVRMVTFMHSVPCSVMLKNNLCNFLKVSLGFQPVLADFSTSYFFEHYLMKSYRATRPMKGKKTAKKKGED